MVTMPSLCLLKKMVQAGGRCSMIAYPAPWLIMLLMDSNDNRNTIIWVLFKVIFYFPNRKSTIWRIYTQDFLFFGSPLSKSKLLSYDMVFGNNYQPKPTILYQPLLLVMLVMIICFMLHRLTISYYHHYHTIATINATMNVMERDVYPSFRHSSSMFSYVFLGDELINVGDPKCSWVSSEIF